ncbi:MAG: hypothetical protein ABJN62_11365 [Halioglobus sp.]
MANLAALRRELEEIKANVNARKVETDRPDDYDQWSPLNQLKWSMKHNAMPSNKAYALAFHIKHLGDRFGNDPDPKAGDLLSDLVTFEFDVLRFNAADGVPGTNEWLEMIADRLATTDKPSHAFRRTLGLIHGDGWSEAQQLRIRLWALRRRAGMQKIAGITRTPEPEPIITPPPEPIVTEPMSKEDVAKTARAAKVSNGPNDPKEKTDAEPAATRWGEYQPAFKYQGHATPTRTKR